MSDLQKQLDDMAKIYLDKLIEKKRCQKQKDLENKKLGNELANKTILAIIEFFKSEFEIDISKDNIDTEGAYPSYQNTTGMLQVKLNFPGYNFIVFSAAAYRDDKDNITIRCVSEWWTPVGLSRLIANTFDEVLLKAKYNKSELIKAEHLIWMDACELKKELREDNEERG